MMNVGLLIVYVKNVKNMNNIIAVYGTLKEGYYNYDYLLKDNSEFLGNHIIKGSMQLANAGYPYLFKKDDYRYGLEIYKVDEFTFESIDAMEKGAGYYSEEIDTPYGKATIYYAEDRLFDKDKSIINKY